MVTNTPTKHAINATPTSMSINISPKSKFECFLACIHKKTNHIVIPKTDAKSSRNPCT